jgi:hypothetical protein
MHLPIKLPQSFLAAQPRPGFVVKTQKPKHEIRNKSKTPMPEAPKPGGASRCLSDEVYGPSNATARRTALPGLWGESEWIWTCSFSHRSHAVSPLDALAQGRVRGAQTLSHSRPFACIRGSHPTPSHLPPSLSFVLFAGFVVETFPSRSCGYGGSGGPALPD